MAAATVVIEEYGFRCHTGTEVATVTRTKQYVTAFIYIPVGTNKTCTITDGMDNAVMTIFGAVAKAPVTVRFFNKPIDGIKVLSNGDFTLLILTK